MSDPGAPRPISTGSVLRSAFPTLDLSLPAWEGAMGACSHYEVMVRILAQKHFAGESITRDIADQGKKKGLLSMLFRKLTFSEKEQRFLLRCNRLRNKLIHCEPDAVLRVLQEIAPAFKPAEVGGMFTLSESQSGDDLVATLTTVRGAVPAQATSSRKDGFLGWMTEAAGNGTFGAAAVVFVKAVLVISAKADQEPKSGQGPGVRARSRAR